MCARRTQDAFLSELFELFHKEGVADLTIGEIARRLKCSRSRLYSVADTKEGMFLVIAKRHLSSLLVQSDAVLSDVGDVVSAITRYLDIGVRASASSGLPFLRDLEATRQGRRLFDAFQARRADGLVKLVELGVAQGVFHARHAELVAEILIGGALRIRRVRFLAKTGLSIEEAFAEFYALLLFGLLKPGEMGAQAVPESWPRVSVMGAKGRAYQSLLSDDEEASDIGDLLLRAAIRH